MARGKKTRVGELRPSQVLYTYGIGAVIDLPNLSAMVMGLDDWEPLRCATINEPRLLDAVQRHLGAQVGRLVSPPAPGEEDVAYRQPLDAASLIGVPVASFPRWLRCPACNFLGPIGCGVFELRADAFRPERTRYLHGNCSKAGGKTPPTALPARFLTACEAGHLDDFPWVDYAHRGAPCARPELVLRELGGSGEAADIEVRCLACDLARRMVDAFDTEDIAASFRCSKRRPHLRDYEGGDKPCTAKRRAILLGASNSWFAVALSALSLPAQTDALAELIEAHWAALREVDEVGVVRFMRKRGELAAFAEYGDDQVLAGIEARRAKDTREDEDDGGRRDLKAPEWALFSQPETARETEDFRLRRVAAPPGFSMISKVVLAERLREVTALIGFTRIVSPYDFGELDPERESRRAPLSRKAPTLAPAAEVRGEGIFLQFDEAQVRAFTMGLGAARDEIFEAADLRWRRQRNLKEEGYPGIRYVLLHSLAHVLMRQLALECGYTAASIRERIYAREPEQEGGPMAGILIYTAASDSEGTLGGLVSLGEPAALGRHLAAALASAGLCSADPLCAEHHPWRDGVTLHGAACHACLFAPETSCERGNKYLDRAVLVDTVTAAGAAFFGRGR